MAGFLPKVPYRLLGKTGLSVSVLGFGASPLGGVFHAVDEEVCRAAVHEAFAAGINFFDTSPFYGATKSETVLGKSLQGLPRSEIVISTKVGRYGQDEFDFSAERVIASVSESLDRLQTDYIDIIQCHDIEFGDLDKIVSDTLPALMYLKDRGLVKHIGITGLPFKIFHQVLDQAPPDVVDVVLSYCHNSLNDSSLIGELPYLESKGVGVISASPLSMGLLTKQGPPSWHPALPELQQATRKAAEMAEAAGMDIARIALAESLRTPAFGIATTLVGMSKPEEVQRNVQVALEALGLLPLGPQADKEAEVLRSIMEGPLSGIQGVTWGSGRPENR